MFCRPTPCWLSTHTGPGAIELKDAIQSPALRSALAARASVEHEASASSSRTEAESLLACQYVLLVIDGTWQQAREMFSAIFAWLPPSTQMVTISQAPFLSREVSREPHPLSHFERVRHPVAHSSPDTDCAQVQIHVEPQQGCMLTAEAVAAALQVAEGGEAGEAIATGIIRPLQEMISIQARFDPSLQPDNAAPLVKPGRVPRRQRPAKAFRARVDSVAPVESS